LNWRRTKDGRAAMHGGFPGTFSQRFIQFLFCLIPNKLDFWIGVEPKIVEPPCVAALLFLGDFIWTSFL
jgi:hypothetical protein